MSRDSPKTMMNSTSLTCTSSNTASTATGSTAAIRLPNRRKSNSPMFRSPARRVDHQGEPSSLEGQSSLHRPCQEGPRDRTVGSRLLDCVFQDPPPLRPCPPVGPLGGPGFLGAGLLCPDAPRTPAAWPTCGPLLSRYFIVPPPAPIALVTYFWEPTLQNLED